MTTEEEIYHVIDPYTDRVIDAHPSPKSLRKLVRKAKQGNEQAQDRLCSLYVATIKSIYNDPLVKYLLGEDAIGIVWELFLRLIKNYTGNDFKRFPGLIKTYLLRRIKNNLRDPGSYKAHVIADSDTLDTISKEERSITQIHENSSFYQLLKGCTPKQIKIAKLIYFYGLDLKYVAEIVHCSEQNIYKFVERINRKALANYNRRLLKNN